MKILKALKPHSKWTWIYCVISILVIIVTALIWFFVAGHVEQDPQRLALNAKHVVSPYLAWLFVILTITGSAFDRYIVEVATRLTPMSGDEVSYILLKRLPLSLTLLFYIVIFCLAQENYFNRELFYVCIGIYILAQLLMRIRLFYKYYKKKYREEGR